MVDRSGAATATGPDPAVAGAAAPGAGTSARSLTALRRYTWWSFVFFVVLCALLPPVWSAPGAADAPSWRGIVLAAGAVAVGVVHLLVLRAIVRTGAARPPAVVLGAAAVLALALPWVSPDGTAGWAVPAAGLLAALVLTRPPAARLRAATLGGLVVVADVGAAAAANADLTAMPSGGLAVLSAIGAALIVAFLVGSYLAQLWIWEIALRLDHARRAEADLAVARERLRFAADLHDLQGHHLQVIALKGELVARLVDVDTDRARDEAEEVAAIARRALADTREVVRGYRDADLEIEVGNAVEVLRAAGIDTTVAGDPAALPDGATGLFTALVREGTTNVLRHSRARRARLEVAATWLRIENDAPTPRTDGDGTGLASLRERFAASGGALEVTRDAHTFAVRGSLPPHRAPRVAP